MNRNRILTRLMATTIACGAVSVAAPVAAQTNPSPPPDTQIPTGPVEGSAADPSRTASAAADSEPAIVVTGSRIPQPNLNAMAPVTVISPQDIRLQGVTRTEDILNALPQVFAGQASTLSNGASGTATVDLRGLLPHRTLVLVNGRRLLPGDPTDSAADLNAVPATLIKRVEVLTGGASATYGADAVAGVVNFIMDTDFSGIRLDGQYSFLQHNNNSTLLRAANNARTAAGAPGFGYPVGSVADGGTYDINVTIGGAFADGRGHAVAYAGYRRSHPVTQQSRDYSSCTAQGNSTTTKDVICGGSAFSAEGNFNDSTSNSYHVAPGRTFLPGRTRYNFAPTNYYQRPDERYTAGFFAHYDVNDAIKPYMEAMFMDDRTLAQIAPSGDFANTNQINCDNPLMSAQEKAIFCRRANLITGFIGNFPLTSLTNPNPAAPPINFIDPNTGLTYNRAYLQVFRRNVEGGPRIADFEHTEYRGVIGSRGDLGKAWSYDAYYQYGRTVYSQVYTGEFSTQKLINALDVVNVNGTPQCRSVRDNPTCVPYDIFALNSVTPAQVAYLSVPGFQRGTVSEQVADASLTGKLGEYGLVSPWATEGISVNIGAEIRKETLNLQTDQEFSTGDLTGQGSPTLPISGDFTVREAFGEVQVPIVHDSVFYDLTLNGGYRYSSYQLSNGRKFSTSTYKLGAEFAPIRDVRFRASYNRAVRAPNIQELFAVVHVQLDGTVDPCAGPVAGGTVNGNTFAQCARTGVTAGQFGRISANPSGQYNGQVGGNGNLEPERAVTKTIGVVFQPRFIPGFAATVDLYDIRITKAIQGYGADTIITTCVNTGDPTFCGLVHRNPAGSLWLTPDGFITDLSHNIGAVHTRGVDLNANYSRSLGGAGSVGLSVVGTYLDRFVVDNSVSTPYDCVGFYGRQCGTPTPKWRGKARLTYTAPDGIGLSVQWRYFGKVSVDASSTNPTLAAPFSVFGAHIPAQSYFDLAATFKVGDHYNFRLGVDNLMDRMPPIISANGGLTACPAVYCNGATFPAVYDAMGRYIFAGVTLDF